MRLVVTYVCRNDAAKTGVSIDHDDDRDRQINTRLETKRHVLPPFPDLWRVVSASNPFHRRGMGDQKIDLDPRSSNRDQDVPEAARNDLATRQVDAAIFGS